MSIIRLNQKSCVAEAYNKSFNNCFIINVQKQCINYMLIQEPRSMTTPALPDSKSMSRILTTCKHADKCVRRRW